VTWSYTHDPRDTPVDEVRFLIGDTTTTTPLVQDEEILYVLGTEATTLLAAVVVAKSIAMKLGREVDKQVGDLKISASTRYKNYLEVLQTLEDRANVALAGPYAGGISVSRKKTVENTADLVKPTFKVS